MVAILAKGDGCRRRGITAMEWTCCCRTRASRYVPVAENRTYRYPVDIYMINKNQENDAQGQPQYSR
jgi:hypothetical protein